MHHAAPPPANRTNGRRRLPSDVHPVTLRNDFRVSRKSEIQYRFQIEESKMSQNHISFLS
ncbi:hypothetical protein [Azospirillum doebereinerae]